MTPRRWTGSEVDRQRIRAELAEAELARLRDAAQAVVDGYRIWAIEGEWFPHEELDALRAVLSSGAASQGEER